MDEKLMKEIYQKHVKQLKNLNVSHEKLVICFSGIAGSGKTYIAKILEDKYRGVRIRNDDIRKIVGKINKNLNLDESTHSYIDWFFVHYKFKNKLIILDSGIDRKYDKVLPLLKEGRYVIFIIRLKVSERVYERRIKNKLGKLDDNYINRIEDWKRQYEEFGKKVKPDIIIENEKDDDLNLSFLFEKLDILIK